MNNTNQPKLCPFKCSVIDEDRVVRKVLKGIEKPDAPSNLKVEDAFALDEDPKTAQKLADPQDAAGGMSPIPGLPQPIHSEDQPQAMLMLPPAPAEPPQDNGAPIAMAPSGAPLALPPSASPRQPSSGGRGARVEEPPSIAANAGDNSEIAAPDDD